MNVDELVYIREGPCTRIAIMEWKGLPHCVQYLADYRIKKYGPDIEVRLSNVKPIDIWLKGNKQDPGLSGLEFDYASNWFIWEFPQEKEEARIEQEVRNGEFF